MYESKGLKANSNGGRALVRKSRLFEVTRDGVVLNGAARSRGSRRTKTAESMQQKKVLRSFPASILLIPGTGAKR